MTQDDKKNYYEILNISPGASRQEIEDAYIRAKSLYGSDSVALYSLYSSEERESMMKKAADAYETLRGKDAGMPAQQAGLNIGRDTTLIEKGEPHKVSYIGNPETEFGFKRTLLVMKDPDSVVAEQYRVLYTRLEQISHRKSYKTFAVTSALKGDGKTVTTLNLAYIIAMEFKRKIIVVECDFKNPSITSRFLDMMPEYGLIDVIEGKAELSDAIVRYKHGGLHLLPAGRIAKNSSELLSSVRVNSILNILKSQYDYVIVDTSPIMPLADVNIISRIVDGLLLVVRAGKTPRDLVLRAVSSLTMGELIGIVLNGADNYPLKEYYH